MRCNINKNILDRQSFFPSFALFDIDLKYHKYYMFEIRVYSNGHFDVVIGYSIEKPCYIEHTGIKWRPYTASTRSLNPFVPCSNA